jgi:membrane protein YdbS with pleckstrin-like domain
LGGDLKEDHLTRVYLPWWRAAWFVVVTDRRVIAKWGILNKTEVALPLNFVQDASVYRSWLGLGRVKVSTAGGPSSGLVLEPLNATDARRLADTIMRKPSAQRTLVPRDAGPTIRPRLSRASGNYVKRAC